MSVEFYHHIPTIQLQAIPFQTLDTPLKDKGFLPPDERYNWLHDYEQLEGSIFKYYNVQNEVKFLKNAEGLSDEKKHYYLQENVKRFLGEFVWKIPYTSIPYEIDKNGISYAGMHVMDSYNKAADMGGERERAETNGFQNIEDTYIKTLIEGEKLPPGAWISPPKIADYGFVFVFIPDAQGHIKEYILRYPEKLDKLETSEKIFKTLSPGSEIPKTTDSYLTQPLFDVTNQKPQKILDSVMKEMKIDEKEILESHRFERVIESALSEWIKSYSDLVMSLASYENDSPLHRYGVLEAKKRLLAIYQKAEEIKNGIHTDTIKPIMPTYDNPLPVDDLRSYAALLQHQSSDLPTTSGGSCPAVQSNDSPLTSSVSFLDSFQILKALTNKQTPESIFTNNKDRYDDYECPKCGGAIKGELIGKPETWTPECPHCHVALGCAKT